MTLSGFLAGFEDQPFDEPLLIEFEPRLVDPSHTFETFKQFRLGDCTQEYLNIEELTAGHLLQGNDSLETKLDADSIVQLKKGVWLSPPGMISKIHRDWGIRSVLNFSFRGLKTWDILDYRHVWPDHANLTFRQERRLLEQIEVGQGWRIEQGPGECVYLPGGFYHRVRTLTFSINFSLWWMPSKRLRSVRHFSDAWWFRDLMQRPHLLKPDCAKSLEAAYQARPRLERLFCETLYDWYLRVCNRVHRNRFKSYEATAELNGATMRALLSSSTLCKAENSARSISAMKHNESRNAKIVDWRRRA